MKLLASATLFSILSFAQDSKPDGLQYVLAPSDNIQVHAPAAGKLDGKTFHIDGNGFVSLPSIGRIRAGGLTIESLEQQIVKRLRRKGAEEPQVEISVIVARR
jgi:protein involved in polysaccharide export with SLBB domain